MRFSEINSEDWEWLKDTCADCAEAATSGRESIIATVRSERPDLLPMLETMIAEYHQHGETQLLSLPLLSWIDTWGFAAPGPQRPTFEPGEVISDRYLVQSYVGRGG